MTRPAARGWPRCWPGAPSRSPLRCAVAAAGAGRQACRQAPPSAPSRADAPPSRRRRRPRPPPRPRRCRRRRRRRTIRRSRRGSATLRGDALAAGIRPATIDAAFATIVAQPVVLERDRSQAEFTLTLGQYVDRRLTPALLRLSREHARREQPPAGARRARAQGAAIDPGGGVGARVELRPVRRRAADRAGAGDAGLRRPPRRAVPRRAAQRAAHPRSRRHRARAAQGIVGRRDGPAAVPALELPEVRAGLRRRRPARHLDVAARRVRLDRRLHGLERLDDRRVMGPARHAAARLRRAARHQGAAAHAKAAAPCVSSPSRCC